MFTDASLLEELVSKAQRGRAQDLVQVGDIYLARLGRYVVWFRLLPVVEADCDIYGDVIQADAAFNEQAEQLRAGVIPPLLSSQG